MRPWLLASLVLFACAGPPGSSTPEPEAEPAHPTPASAVLDVPEPDATTTDPADAPPPVASVQLNPDHGALSEQLVVEAARAYRAGRRPIVEMHASWCPICRRVDAELDHPRAREALHDVVLLRVDTDIWADDLRRAGLRSPTIPAFYRLDRRGKPGKHLDGHRWKPDTDVITDLDHFVHATE